MLLGLFFGLYCQGVVVGDAEFGSLCGAPRWCGGSGVGSRRGCLGGMSCLGVVVGSCEGKEGDEVVYLLLVGVRSGVVGVRVRFGIVL